MSPRSILAGCGGYLPERVVTNEELSRTVDTSDEWIRERTGIRQRHFAGKNETAAFMGTAAARAALADAGATRRCGCDHPGDQHAGPGVPGHRAARAGATRRHAGLRLRPVGGLRRVHLWPVGWRQHDLLRSGARGPGDRQRGLLAHPQLARPRHLRAVRGRRRRRLPAASDVRDDDRRGVLSTHIHAQGTLGDILYVDGAVGQPDKPGHLVMNGREVFRHAVTKLAEAVEEALAANGLTHADVDWLVPHQANRRIIDAMGRKLKLPPERVVVTVDRHANTSAASVPLALAEARADGRIGAGDLVLLEALGGGLTWGSALVRL